MATKTTIVLCLFSLLSVGLIDATLTIVPDNTASMVGTTVILRCSAASAPASRIMWTEFASNPTTGNVISDNRNIIATHPNAERYSIVGTGFVFDLEISNLTLDDGGKYLCQDIQGTPDSPPFRGHAELIIMLSDPVCTAFPSITGALVEGRQYDQECEIKFQGNYGPNMTWTGPGAYEIDRSNTATTVWTQISFTAHRDMQDGAFVCTTRYFLPLQMPPDSATNSPDYVHTNPTDPLVIQWGPTDMVVTPIKDFYVTGDVIACIADSNPTSKFQWTNMRTIEAAPPGAVFIVTSDLEGYDQPMRCNANVMIEGSIFSSDIFVNVSVPAVTGPTTIPTTVPTTPPPADAPCTDLTGHWSSTNPTAHLCIETDSKGNILTLIRNGTDTYFVAGNGKTMMGDYKHVGFTGIWPATLGGAAGFTGECHRCQGNEVILLSGLSRDKKKSPACGLSAGTQVTKLYVLTRYGPPCRNLNAKVYRPSPEHIKHMGIQEKDIIR